MAYRIFRNNFYAFQCLDHIAKYHDYVRVAMPGKYVPSLVASCLNISFQVDLQGYHCPRLKSSEWLIPEATECQ